MSTPARSIINQRKFAKTCSSTVGCGLLRRWHALPWRLLRRRTQHQVESGPGLSLRNESTETRHHGQGDFATPEALKIYQEIVVQSARSPAVVEAALKELGPENGDEDPNYPTSEIV